MALFVPVNGALGRLLCKFVAIFVILLLLAWTLSSRQKSASEVAELEGKLKFAQEQLSSLHAQIDVITRHKEKIESLLKEERQQRFEQTKNEYSERIEHLEAKNVRCEKALVELNRTMKTQNIGQILVSKNQSIGTQNGEIVGQQNIGMKEQQPIMEPAEEKEEEENMPENNELMEEPQQKDEDPFEEGENDGRPNGIVGQIKPPNEFAKVEEKRQTKKEPNGAEKLGEDYIFQRPVPREDLVFQREAEEEEGKGKNNWMGRRELMKKLAEKNEQKAKKEEELQDHDFRE